MNWRLLTGDVRDSLRTLPTGTARTCVTSPPYWGLRDYGVEGQLGLEPTPDAYVAAMVEVFREVRRVLAEDGTLWLNLGDSYARDGGAVTKPGATAQAGNTLANVDTREQARAVNIGLKPKDLVGIPWMLAFALRADGWYLRSDIIWHKPNPMPESVTDRPTKAHEYIFLLSKAKSYYYDADAIAEASIHAGAVVMNNAGKNSEMGQFGQTRDGFLKPEGVTVADTRNKRSVWTIATQPYPDAHFATFPEALIEPCILAGSAIGDTVLDPFTGSGTTGAVAIRHQRSFVGTELNPAYVELARQRIGKESPLFAMEGSS